MMFTHRGPLMALLLAAVFFVFGFSGESRETEEAYYGFWFEAEDRSIRQADRIWEVTGGELVLYEEEGEEGGARLFAETGSVEISLFTTNANRLVVKGDIHEGELFSEGGTMELLNPIGVDVAKGPVLFIGDDPDGPDISPLYLVKLKPAELEGIILRRQ